MATHTFISLVTVASFGEFKKALIAKKMYSHGRTIKEGVLRDFQSRLHDASGGQKLTLRFECDEPVAKLFIEKCLTTN